MITNARIVSIGVSSISIKMVQGGAGDLGDGSPQWGLGVKAWYWVWGTLSPEAGIMFFQKLKHLCI